MVRPRLGLTFPERVERAASAYETVGTREVLRSLGDRGANGAPELPPGRFGRDGEVGGFSASGAFAAGIPRTAPALPLPRPRQTRRSAFPASGSFWFPTSLAFTRPLADELPSGSVLELPRPFPCGVVCCLRLLSGAVLLTSSLLEPSPDSCRRPRPPALAPRPVPPCTRPCPPLLRPPCAIPRPPPPPPLPRCSCCFSAAFSSLLFLFFVERCTTGSHCPPSSLPSPSSDELELPMVRICRRCRLGESASAWSSPNPLLSPNERGAAAADAVGGAFCVRRSNVRGSSG